MLTVTYHPNFNQSESFMVKGTQEEYLIASKYMAQQTSTTLKDPNCFIYKISDDIKIDEESLKLKELDCRSLASTFSSLANNPYTVHHLIRSIEDMPIVMSIKKTDD